MDFIDSIVLSGTLIIIVAYGIYKTRKESRDAEAYVRGDKNTRWWTIGLSVMATQASAITFLSTPGQSFNDGMGFIQFYFGLPLAMIIICIAFIPIYHKLNVYTAYEFLESRFDKKTRVLTAILFLMQRGLAAGITIFAPSIILSTVLGWPLSLMNLIIGVLVILYTVFGGTKAVNITQKQQMLVIMSGMVVTFIIIVFSLPENVSFSKALHISGINNKLNALDFSFDPKNKYTFWSGITGGLFLSLSYFGTDQSQVQRYISASSMKQKQIGLLFNAVLKIPIQTFILLTGVMLFVFYQYNKAPLHFNPVAQKAILNSPKADEYKLLQKQYDSVFQYRQKESISDQEILTNHEEEILLRQRAKTLIKEANLKVETNDKDYVFIRYILTYLPVGLVGLLLAVIISAAMSSSSSELNALGVTTAMDLYKSLGPKDKPDAYFLKSSKWFTLLWGVIAVIFANLGNLVENLIQLINIVGSIFYGNVLGIFLVGFFIKYVKARAILWAAICTQVILFLIFYLTIFDRSEPLLGYLWLNAIGCVSVILISVGLQYIYPKNQ